MENNQTITNKLKNFKNLVLKGMLLNSENQREVFNKIPDEYHSYIFENNFNSNYPLARKIILSTFDQNDYKKLEKEKAKIHDMLKASKYLSFAVTNEKEKVLFLTDTDNDGSLSQANILAFKKALPPELKSQFEMLYCQQINGNSARGFTVDLVDAWVDKNPSFKDKKFTIISADNGINSLEEQEKINKKYPLATLIVTDHHNPDEICVVKENKQTMIVNPKYKPTKYFQEKNISGANVLGVLLEKTLENFESSGVELIKKTDSINHMREISRFANLVDYVLTDIADKPLKDYLIEKYLTLGASMNVNNSLSKMITTPLDGADIKDLFSDVDSLNVDLIVETISRIKEQNKLAEKLISLQNHFDALPKEDQNAVSKDRIYQDIIMEIGSGNNEKTENINPNFIEQLRPFMCLHATAPDLLDYEAGILTAMEDVYKTLKKEERVLQTEFGKVSLMNIEKLENSTIMYPKNSNHLTILNRKLLGKIYNEENNGFLMILDSVLKEKATGSFRSTYRIQDIMNGKASIEELLNVDISSQGHDMAAGFFIEKNDGAELTAKMISDVNSFINKGVDVLKIKDKRNYAHLIQTDLSYETMNVFNLYNKVIKGGLTNMQSLSPVVHLTKSTYLTNSKTLVDENLQQIVKGKKYGYVPVSLSFDNKTVIIPTEMLRQVVDSNFKSGIQVSFMSDGAFIGQKVIPDVNKQKLLKIKSNKNESKDMIKFYEEKFQDKHFVDLPIEYIMDSVFFKANKNGLKEKKRFEETVIDIIEKAKVEKFVVLDVEANGLGSSPKLINIGAVELYIDKLSGEKYKSKDFNKKAFKSTTGKRFLLKDDEFENLESITKEEYSNLSFKQKQMVLSPISDDSSLYISESFDKYAPIYNYKKIGSTVTVNREIKATMFSSFVKNNDTKVSGPIETLTGINNTLLNKVGLSTKQIDEIMYERYKDIACIYQAHNLPYDLKVILSNLNETYKLMTSSGTGNILNDSAICSRERKYAYDPVNISVFEKDVAPALHGLQFFHAENSPLSVKNFLENEEDGNLPDRTGRHILKKKDGVISVVDTTKNTTVIVEPIRVSVDNDGEKLEDERSVKEILLDNIKNVDMPNNSIKFAVQELANYNAIRTMIISSTDFEVKQVPIPEMFKLETDKLDFFMMNYHFETSFNENFKNFQLALTKDENENLFVTDGFIKERIEELEAEWKKEQAEIVVPKGKRKKKMPNFSKEVGADPKVLEFTQFAKDFLFENKEIQSRLHETWAYKKILKAFNPTKESLKDNDLISLISYQTSMTEEKVRAVALEAITFKEKYKVDNVLVIEPHQNLYFDKSDVGMETVLTIKIPVDREYNSFSHSNAGIVDMFMINAARTTFQHQRSQSKNVSIDAYSRTQALSYKRQDKSDYIKRGQLLVVEDVKFSLKKDTLPNDTFAYGVLKSEVSEEKIGELSDKLSFVVQYEQMKNSISSKKYESKEARTFEQCISGIMDANEEKVTKIKEELSENFLHIYHSKKENDIKKCLELIQGAILNDEKIVVPRTMKPLMKRDKDLIIDLAERFSEVAIQLGVSKIPQFVKNDFILIDDNTTDNFVASEKTAVSVAADHTVMNFISKIKEDSEENKLEAHEKEMEELRVKFADNPEEIEKVIRDKTIIDKVLVKRTNDSKQILSKFPMLVEQSLSYLLEKSLKLDSPKALAQKISDGLKPKG